MKLMRFQPAYAAVIVQTRELVYIEMWAGQMACEGLNWLLKETIQQERPNCEFSFIFHCSAHVRLQEFRYRRARSSCCS